MSMVATAIAPTLLKEDEEHILTQYYFGKPNGSHTRGILKSKENISKNKLHKSLKKKLKKYKLKKDGTEDPEVIDVSQTFRISLKLRSPHKGERFDELEYDELERRENYLTKMVRRKQSLLSLNKEERTGSKHANKAVSNRNTDSEEDKINMDKVTAKQTNAFKLLMESRNKSIGGNSPGKDKSVDVTDLEENLEKNKLKIKRKLALQKMAEVKGALQKKELEELQEEHIKDKMLKRAERLKKMLCKGDRNQKKEKQKIISFVDEETEDICITSQVKVPESISSDRKMAILMHENNTHQSGLLAEKRNALVSPNNKKTLLEDQDFLSKLSPSIKKKENMLCYFKKIVKEPDEFENQPIKVKIALKAKKKTKRRKLSLNKNKEPSLDKNEDECNEHSTVEIDYKKPITHEQINIDDNDKKCRKRKRKNITQSSKTDNNNINTVEPEKIAEGRPKRSIKKPVKYTDDGLLSSSDDELHVFTPKKKKHILSNDTPKQRVKNSSLPELNITKYPDQDIKGVVLKNTKDKCRPSNAKSNTKLAPIFKKTQLDPAALEAKHKFLQSGMPEQLKKMITNQKVQDTVAECFYSVVHVQQSKLTPKVSLINFDFYNYSESECSIEGMLSFDQNVMIKLLQTNKTQKKGVLPFTNIDVPRSLKNIKENYPQFPVYRTYKTLINKKKGDHKDLNCTDFDNSSEVLKDVLEPRLEDPDHLTWCSKYRATSTKQILGNFDSVQELRKWLITWTNNDACAKSNNNTDSDSDFDQYDTDSRDSMRISNNLLALTGPVGSGKTSSVYAVACELAIKVIEVNVSSRRTGKILLQDLQEATQSHKVNRAKGSSAENSQNSQELLRSKASKGSKKQLKKSKTLSDEKIYQNKSDSKSQSQEDGRTGMSLILIDDADIVFEQDDGFVSAIAQLIQCSKRPVILVVTSLNSQHLQKFLLSGTILTMNSLSPRILGTWLDIMCLVDCNLCWPGIGEKCLEYYKGDVRKATNFLHFLVASEAQKQNEGNVLSNFEEQKICEVEDEYSNFSWVDHDEGDDKQNLSQQCTLSSETLVRDRLITSALDLLLIKPLELFHVWWSLPNILKPKDNDSTEKTSESKQQECLFELQYLSNALDSISVADCISYKIKPDSKINVTSNPWMCEETDSVSESENFDYVNNSGQVLREMSDNLVMSSLNNVGKSYKTRNDDFDFPRLADLRSRDKIINRHNMLTNAINPSSMLDRKALALDYWSTCRSICRTEKEKTNNNSKRHKRFTHYLKSSMVINNSTLNKLCDSLSTVEEGQ